MTRKKASKRGIGTIVGTMFFIIIVIMVMTILVSVFSSFSNYVQVFESYDQQIQQNHETSFSISSLNFVTPPLTSSSPVTVGTSTNQQANAYSNENKLLYAQGLWWLFYSSGSAIVCRTSANGLSWSAPVTVTTSATSSVGYTFSIWLSGTTIYYALSNNQVSGSFLWRYGTLNSGGTISWSIPESSVSLPNPARANNYISIVTDNSGNVWVALADNRGSVEVFSNLGGTWNRVNIVTGTVPILVPVTSGIVLIYGSGTTTTGTVYITTTVSGSSWTTSISPPSQYALLYCSAFSVGNLV